MKCKILHESRGRMRVHFACGTMTLAEADIIEYWFKSISDVEKVTVYDRTGDAVILYRKNRESIINALSVFSFAKAKEKDLVPEHTSRELNREFEDKLVFSIIRRAFSKTFFPAPLRAAIAVVKSFKYIKAGLSVLIHGKLTVAVLDATAVSVSILRGDYNTAGSVMFMLGIGELLEEWTHKKSVADLAGAMSLNIDKVWVKNGECEQLVPINEIAAGDSIVVRTGSVIPLDGKVTSGEMTVNQSSMTGESIPVLKHPGSYVYAGTVVDEGKCIVTVDKACGSGRYDRVIKMIEESEKLKSDTEEKAYKLADKLVPYTFIGTGLVYLLTRNTTKMLAVLMVDFSCALKLSMPIAVLSAMRECSSYHISVKGGKFLEAAATADTIVFDKTGTLTHANPTVVDIVTFGDHKEDDMLRLAACLEEHYPHSIANAVVAEAKRRGLSHEEYHSCVEYVVAHGISSKVNGEKVVIGSAQVGVDEFHAEVLPENKAEYIREAKKNGHVVMMIGDGVNDSPALSEADVGIAINSGAAIAKEIADVTISSESLYEIVMLRKLSSALIDRINGNYRFIVGFNLLLIALGISGFIMPTTSALLHNTSTLMIGLKSMTDLLPNNKEL